MTALEQTSEADARRMFRELEARLRMKNESAAESLRETFDELSPIHCLKMPALLRKPLLSTDPIESVFSLVWQSERNIKRTRGSRMLQRWLGRVLLACEGRFKRVKGLRRDCVGRRHERGPVHRAALTAPTKKAA